jgi:hypothetical protein
MTDHPQPTPDPRYVTVANFGAVFEAELARGRLEAEGIPAQVRDANTAAITGHHMVEVMGGVRLQVLEQDEARALEVLQTARGDERDRAVFLVRISRARQAALFGALAGGALGAWLVSGGGELGLGALIAAAGALLGVVLGRRSLRFECSDPKCATRNQRGAATCAGCDGIVRGEIKSRDERLAAEEELGL